MQSLPIPVDDDRIVCIIDKNENTLKEKWFKESSIKIMMRSSKIQILNTYWEQIKFDVLSTDETERELFKNLRTRISEILNMVYSD